MKRFVKIAAAALAAVLLPMTAASCGAKKTALIGISQFGEHASLDNCREGFLAGLADAGLVEGEDYTIDYQNAGFDAATATQIAQGFSAENAALMCAVATPSATACFAAAEDKDIPVVFTAITDPVGAGLSEGNITGTSDVLPVEGQLKLIRALQPDAKKIGILYTTSEPNSIYTIAQYEALAPAYGFEIVSVGVSTQSEVISAAADALSRDVDCLSNLTDNTVVGVLPSILELTNEAKIPVYGSEQEQVKIGCLGGAGLNYYELGRQTGAMAAKILRGEATAADLPFETITEYGLFLNETAAAELGITVPADISFTEIYK